MSHPPRSTSESYQAVCCSVSDSVSYCSEDGVHVSSSEDDDTPIFSISKSSVDVLTATGPPHLRDAAFARLDLRRSSSSSDQHSCIQQLNPCQYSSNSPSLLTKQNLDSHNPPSQALSERWISSMQRWSGCSAQSRSSTPDTVIFKGSRPSSVIQEKLPDSPNLSKLPSFSRTPSPPNSSKLASFSRTPSPPNSSKLASFSRTPSPPNSSKQASHSRTPSPPNSSKLTSLSRTPSPPNSSKQASHSRTPSPPNSSKLTSLSRTPSPPNSSKLASPLRTPSTLVSPLQTPTSPWQNISPIFCQQLENLSPNANSPQLSPLPAKIISPLPPKELLRFTFPSPVSSSVSLDRVASEDLFDNIKSSTTEASLDELLTDVLPENFDQEFEKQDFVLPELANFPSTWRRPLVTSFSDSYLRECGHCNDNFSNNFKGLAKNKNTAEGTMTSQVELVDIGVQTVSPIGSWWSLKRNVSNVGSPSILGSPPGSRLNLRSPVGSHSNLVSPSSSMFPVNSEEEDSKVEKEDLTWETSSNVNLERPRSCLKISGENRELGRRSSMKQVQWDEDGMTWDVHGASIDPEELNMAIQKHLELKCKEELKSPKPLRKSSKKRRAPKPPVLLKPPLILIEGRGLKKEDRKDAMNNLGEREAEEDLEVYGDGVRSKSPSHGSVQSRKWSVIRSFKKPGWCGASRKEED